MFCEGHSRMIISAGLGDARGDTITEWLRKRGELRAGVSAGASAGYLCFVLHLCCVVCARAGGTRVVFVIRAGACLWMRLSPSHQLVPPVVVDDRRHTVEEATERNRVRATYPPAPGGRRGLWKAAL
jgi:hypothetical protein